jgi:hypothetical protein
MATNRPMSPRALSLRRPKLRAWGIILLIIWFGLSLAIIGITSLSGGISLSMRIVSSQVLTFYFLIGGIVLLIISLNGDRKARAFNNSDWALADGLAGALDRLWRTPPIEAYEQRQELQIIANARLVEIERHFDQQTEGAITGTMAHKMRMFGTSFSNSYERTRRSGRRARGRTTGSFSGSINGLSQVDLGINSTTRANLMGDALFAVFEAAGPAGARDTFRVISMSQPGVRSWIQTMVQHAADQFGGSSTHSGTTMLAWAGNLMAQFQPSDISYVTDRLKAISAREYEDREPVDIIGTPAGRNAVVATSVRIAGGEELRMMPTRFPELLGTAVAEGVAAGERTLESSQERPAIAAS